MDNNSVMALCLCLGVASWVVAGILALSHRRNVTSVIRYIGLGVFLSLFFLVYPYATVQSRLFGWPLALFQVMAAAVVASDPLAIFETLQANYTASYLEVYQAIVLLLHVIAPLFTIGITLSFFGNRFAVFLYRLRSNSRDSHIFSDVNERTLCLAESIYATNKKSVIVFSGVQDSLEENRDYAERIRAIRGIVMERNPAEIRHRLHRTRTYYLLGPDGARNLKEAVRLFEKYDKIGGNQIKIWLYSKDEISSIIFDNLDEKIDIRLVNEEQLIAMSLMQRYPLTRGVKDNRLVFLLLGAGHIGLEILRTALWCSRLGKDIICEFHVMDLHADQAAQKLEKTCPGMAVDYRVHFYNADVETAAFSHLLGQIRPTYVVATLGQEQRNIAACVEMRRLYGAEGGFPLIHVLIDHADTETMILDRLDISDWTFSAKDKAFHKRELCRFSLLPFGSYAETYSSVRFSRGYHDMLAMAINAVRCGIAETDPIPDVEYLRDLLNKVEFYKNFSYAYATAIPYKLWLMGLQFTPDGKGDLHLLEEALPRYEDVLMDQEASRWIGYMRSLGWQPMPLQEVENGMYQDKLRKRHARLDLNNIPQLAALVGRDFDGENRADIYRLPTILRLANRLSATPYSVIPLDEERKNVL